jgi:hypothetical protein
MATTLTSSQQQSQQQAQQQRQKHPNKSSNLHEKVIGKPRLVASGKCYRQLFEAQVKTVFLERLKLIIK